MDKLEIISMVIGPVQTNVYLAVNRETGECLVVDPADDAERIMQKIGQMQVKPAAILLTHGHFDHILAVGGLKEHYNIPVYCSEDEALLLKTPGMNMSLYHEACVIDPDVLLKDGETLTLAGFEIRAIATPGHTAGGMCYYLPEEGFIFTGDTLFWRSIGRTDLPTGDEDTLIRSVRTRLMKLPDETKVLPGHGPGSTIGAERRQNPFI